jgi:uncharacterized protein (DUF488 family)
MAERTARFGAPNLVIWTIGHSTRTAEDFLELLAENQIELLADVRQFPTSQRVPWSKKTALASILRERGIDYEHFHGLGGYRKPIARSVNTAWRNSSFRGYADHMSTSEFAESLNRLIARASEKRTAIMCAEAVPWKCHRSVLSDSLLAHGVRVVHILGPGKTQEHRLTPFAKVHGIQVTYPGTTKVFSDRGP